MALVHTICISLCGAVRSKGRQTMLAMASLVIALVSEAAWTEAAAEPICSIWNRWLDDTLTDGTLVTFRGRITKDYDGETPNPTYNTYVYQITDNCSDEFTNTIGVVTISRITCQGEVSITGRFWEETSYISPIISVDYATCM